MSTNPGTPSSKSRRKRPSQGICRSGVHGAAVHYSGFGGRQHSGDRPASLPQQLLWLLAELCPTEVKHTLKGNACPANLGAEVAADSDRMLRIPALSKT
jgi:hypothetical protein